MNMIKKYINKLCSMRAGAASLGHAVAVSPIFGLRVSMAIGLGSFDIDVAGWGKVACLPFELLIPFALGLYFLGKNPTIKPLGFTAKTVFSSLIISPFVTVLFLIMFYWVARGSGGDQSPIMLILGLVPSVGTLGLIGFVFVFFPLILGGWFLALGLDSIIFYLYSAGLEDIRKGNLLHAQQNSADSKFRRFFLSLRKKTQRSREYQILIVKEEINKSRQNLIKELNDIKEKFQPHQTRSSSDSQPDLWEEILRQLVAAEEKYLAFYDVLIKKLHSEEITFSRYHTSARQVYLTIIDHIGEVITCLKTGLLVEAQGDEHRINQLLSQNDDALRTMDSAIVAIGAIKTKNLAEFDQPFAINDLEELAGRAGKYSKS